MTQLWVTLSLDDDDESEVLQRALRHYWAVRRREKEGRQRLLQTVSSHV
jgi:hypothetical protein